MAKMSIIFDGFKTLAEQIDASGGDLKSATVEALEETQKHIQRNLEKASAPYASKSKAHPYITGEMYKSIIRDAQIDWHGAVAEVPVGFSYKVRGGYHSIFIMYGTPRITKNQKIYNAIKGTKTMKDIAELQESVMRKYLSLGGD